MTSHILRSRWQDLLYPLQTVQGSFLFWANIKSGSLLCGLVLGESSILRCEKYVLEILEKLIRYVYETKILAITCPPPPSSFAETLTPIMVVFGDWVHWKLNRVR